MRHFFLELLDVCMDHIESKNIFIVTNKTRTPAEFVTVVEYI